MSIVLGNTAARFDSKRYDWTFYVRGATHCVDTVTIRLHPSFKQPVRTRSSAPFEFHSRGWGTFDIAVQVRWVGGEVWDTEWPLQFQEPDAFETYQVPESIVERCGPSADASEGATDAAPGCTTDHDSASSSAADIADLCSAVGALRASLAEVPESGSGSSSPRGEAEAAVAEAPQSESRNDLGSPVPRGEAEASAGEVAAAAGSGVPAARILANKSSASARGAAKGRANPRPADGAAAGASAPASTARGDGARRNATSRAHTAAKASSRSPRSRSPPAAVGSTASGGGAGASPARDVAQANAAGPDSLPPLAEGYRDAQCALLAEAAYHDHDNPLFMHGRAYRGNPSPPKCTWKCSKPPRDDHSAPKWLTASEFEDKDGAMTAKCEHLAELIRCSRKTVLYTGAGISAAVIGQAARSGANTVGWKADTRKAQPTFTHHALGFLGRQGLVHSWVQQNHDGLPQKAGFPQESINEIHGSWYDPGNPVVKYSGTLHDRAFPWMEEDAQTADLVLVLGTSLGGLNADQVPLNAAHRSCRGRSLGAVIINLQQTEQDGKMTLRIFGKSDDVLQRVLFHLGYGRIRLQTPVWSKESRALVLYDETGHRVADGGRRMWLDLRDRQKVRLTPGHNIQGARQPMYMHIGAPGPRKVGGRMREPAEGIGTVVKREDDSASFILDIDGATMRLGIWWLETAARGAVDVLPLVNVRPVFEDA